MPVQMYCQLKVAGQGGKVQAKTQGNAAWGTKERQHFQVEVPHVWHGVIPALMSWQLPQLLSGGQSI